MMHATGGVGVYDTLWGLVQKHAVYCLNRYTFTDGRCPYTLLTGKKYAWNPKKDYVFGSKGVYYIPKELRTSKMDPTGESCIWVGTSAVTHGASIIVPIK